MIRRSGLVVSLLGAGLLLAAAFGCQASASFGSGNEAAQNPPPPPPPPPPPATTEPAPTAAPTTPAPAPTTPAPEPTKSTAVVKGDSVQIPGQIEFESGKATLKPGGTDKVIEQLKLFLDENPRVTKLRIEGHTDNVGTPAANEKLSQERALAVKAAVVAKGGAKERLLAVGCGQNKPIADNSTEPGRATNRRTEFRIAELGGKKYMGMDPLGGCKASE
jgi:OOP family OmpA-OmpF porin